MNKHYRLIAFVLLLAVIAALPGVALAEHGDDPITDNLHDMGHDVAPASLLDPALPGSIHTDLAFWGRYAFQGNYFGFRIMDISAPGNPRLVSFTNCNGSQGDVSVWGNILVRSLNSASSVVRDCDGEEIPAGFEGLHIFDISDVSNPELIADVQTFRGSHTHTMIPDLENDRLLVYNNASNGSSPWFEIVEIPLGDPASPQVINIVPLQDGATRCHDLGAITGSVNLAACASRANANVFDISDPANPVFLYSIAEPGVGIGGSWHSAAFSWDGAVIVLGWEPGGGGRAECEASDDDVKKSAFFYDSATGAKLGQWTLPRPQSSIENCTIHNYNVVPIRDGSYVLVHGSYQSGTSVVDFSDPGNAFEVAYTDPPPLITSTGNPDIGGAWSSYWYNNFMYESNITEGLNVFRLSDEATAGAMMLDHQNPQTQEFTID